MTSKCVISLDLPEDIVAPLRDQFDLQTWSGKEAMPEVTLQDWLADAEGLLCALSTSITASVIAGAAQLKVISTISVGVDHIDLAAATAAGIPVGHTPGVLVDSTADLAVGLMIAATRRIAEADRWMRTGQWSQGWQSDLLLGTDLSQATVGIVGLGGLGHMGVKFAHALGAHTVMITTSPHKAEDAKSLGADDVLISSDANAMKKENGEFDFILNTIPVNHSLDKYLDLLKVDATMCIVGAIEPLDNLNAAQLLFGRKNLSGSIIGGIKETQEMLDFCGEKQILSEVEVIRMDEINEAYVKMQKNEVKYRFVVDLSTL